MARGNRVFFLRHGQYTLGKQTGDGTLTALGKRQARGTAKRFDEAGVTKLFASDLIRAQQTADIIAGRLNLRVSTLSMLREALPTGVNGRRVSLETRRIGKDRVEQTIARFLSKPPRSGNTLVVCHGNLIRAIVCRVLGTGATTWMELGTFHCGLTTFQFRETGDLVLQSFNDAGHLPAKLATVS